MKRLVLVSMTLVASLVLAACKSHKAKTSSASSPSASSPAKKAAPPATPPAASAPAPAAKPAPVAMTSYNLGTAGKMWKGWTAKGVKGAKVMVDGIHGARIAANGPSILDQKPGGDNGFDIIFEQTKENFKKLKKAVSKGATHGMTIAFTSDTPDLLAWTDHMGKTTSYNFEMHMKVAGKNITCHSNIMVGAGNKAELKREMDACKTLASKK